MFALWGLTLEKQTLLTFITPEVGVIHLIAEALCTNGKN